MSRETFDQIVAGVLDRRVVPFVGAGISFTARLPEGTSGEPHKTPQMVGALRRVLKPRRKPRRDDSLAELCEKYLWQLEAAGCATDDAYRQLVEALQIDVFAELLPARAHRYLAFLTREGFIGEIFTTNYDVCLERAYLESWGIEVDPRRLVNDPEAAREVQERVARIWDLDSYRTCAGLSAEESDDDGRRIPARLKVYKLNGCACELLRCDAEQRRLARTILLTEVQLQDFRKRVWARDLFRDRLRSKSLLFCGFGSPEPQVRHTVIQVLEELGGLLPAPEPGGLPPAAEAPPNRPFVVCYEEKPRFHQEQIVNAFAAGVPPAVRRNEKVRPEDLVFHAGHAAAAWPQWKDDLASWGGLTADFFFEQLYRRVMVAQLRRVLHPRSPAVAQLRALLPGVDGVLQEVRSGLEAEGPARSPAASPARSPAASPAANRLGLLDDAHPSAGGIPRLACWLHAMAYDGPPVPGCYIPLVGNEQLAVELLVVLSLLGAFGTPVAGRCPELRPDPHLGLEVTLPGRAAAGLPDPVFYLAAAGRKPSLADVELSSRGRLHTQILLGCGERMHRPEVFDVRLREPGADGEPGCLRTLHVARIALLEILRQVPPYLLGREGARRALVRAVLAPSSVVDRRRPRLEQRLRRLEAA